MELLQALKTAKLFTEDHKYHPIRKFVKCRPTALEAANDDSSITVNVHHDMTGIWHVDALVQACEHNAFPSLPTSEKLEEWPEKPEFTSSKPLFQGGIVELARLFSLALLSASKDKSRYNINGVWLSEQSIYSTDGHRLAEFPFLNNDIDGPIENTFLATTQVKQIVGIVKLGEKGKVNLSRVEDGTGGWLTLHTSNLVANFRLDAAYMPDFNKIIPACTKTHCISPFFEKELKNLKSPKGEVKFPVTFKSDGTATVTQDFGMTVETAWGSGIADGATPLVTLNLAYLKDALRQVGKHATIQIDGDTNPVVFSGENGKAVVMPFINK